MSLAATAIVLLASGTSTRFGGDKLMAPFRGAPLLRAAGSALADERVAARIAVVGTAQASRRADLIQAGWTLAGNPDPEAGQGYALACGIRVAAQTGAENILILLADMPLVPDDHLRGLASLMDGTLEAVMTDAGGTLMPPAIFARRHFEALSILSGDRGARRVFEGLSATGTLPLDPALARDVDTPADLAIMEAACHA